jgi:hypothetical protein
MMHLKMMSSAGCAMRCKGRIKYLLLSGIHSISMLARRKLIRTSSQTYQASWVHTKIA